jgi:hypothetical protein
MKKKINHWDRKIFSINETKISQSHPCSMVCQVWYVTGMWVWYVGIPPHMWGNPRVNLNNAKKNLK